jgi:hypothetical protein
VFAALFRQAAALAASAVASELRKPENQAKLAAAAQAAAAKVRDPETSRQIESLALDGARRLGRALGDLRNRD